MTRKVVYLQDIAVFTGGETDARKYAYGLVLQIRDKHTYKTRANKAFVTASALAILRGGTDEFRPETPHSPWTVTIKDAAVPARKLVAA